MRIRRLHIEGFGRFADRRLGPFEWPVTVFLGPNEAGKSTLLEFVRRVFFGFPDGRSSSNPYPPLAGGQHGGSVTIVSEAGETVTVQRYQGARGGPVGLTAASGEPLSDVELSRLLGRHSREVFQNVFTFTLEELHDENLLKDDRVNAQIYSVGMGATKLPTALKALGSAKRELFLKGGEKHKIRKAADELKEIDSRLAKVAKNAEEYSRLTFQLKGTEAELERLKRLRRKHQSNLDAQNRLENAWDDWNDLNQAEWRLSELPAIDDFPVNGVGRLETLEKQIRTARQECNDADANVEGAKARAEAPVGHEAILNHSPDIRKLELGSKSFGDAVRDLPKRDTELKGHERSLAATLRDLGADWDEVRLENFDLSLAVREDISQFQQRLLEAGRKLGERKSTLTQHETLLKEGTQAEGRAQRELDAAVKLVSRKNGRRVLPAICLAAGLVLLAVGALREHALLIGIGCFLFVCIAAYLFLLTRELDRAKDLTRQWQSRVQKSRKAVEEAERSLQSIQREWRQWLADRKLRETFLPETVVELRGKVELGRNQLGGLRSHQERIRAIRKDIDKYIELAAPLASDFGVPFDANDLSAVAAAARKLTSLHDEVDGKVKDRKAAKEELNKADRQLKQRTSNLREAEAELEDLLQSAAAADVEDFRSRAEIARRRMDLQKKRDGALAHMSRLSGPGEAFDALKKQLGDTDIQEIRDAKRMVEEEIESADAEIRNRSTDRGSIQTDLKNLIGEKESSKWRVERQRLLERMRGHAREWVIRVIAENLLKEAQRKFEKERQPGVVRHAESFFKDITDGRYRTVFSPLGRSEIQVTDSDGVPRQPFQLSRGTREQLFLSLRFGLIQELGQRSERLPVIVDEALVNFDPERGLRVARAFVELSRTNQVLVFTCHPTIVELFQNAAAQSGVQEPEVIPIG